MLSKKLSKRIRTAAEEMNPKELLEYLQDLEQEGKIEINYNDWDYAIDFALYLVNKMKDTLDSGQWYGYKLKALQTLNDIPCEEWDIVKIDNYGFPKEVSDNDDLLYVLGIENQLDI
jgi:hypothetical protein